MTDILERPMHNDPVRPFDPADTDDFYRYTIPYGPYEIVTLKITSTKPGDRPDLLLEPVHTQ